MSDYPIIFSEPMVQALLAGRKTMTRRLARGKPITRRPTSGTTNSRYDGMSPWTHRRPGDRLYVREAHAYPNDQVTIYRANWREDAKARGLDNIPADDSAITWRPSIHLPRKDSRLTLVVTAVKIERLQSISYADVLAEGFPSEEDPHGPESHIVHTGRGTGISCRLWFHQLWDQINGEGAWDANPEVVALTFAVHKINQMSKEVA